MIIQFPKYKLEKHQDMINKYNRKALKYGFPLIKFEIIETYYRPVEVHTINRVVWPNTSTFVGIRDIAHIKAEIEGEVPKFNGWSIICSLDHSLSPSIVKKSPNFHKFEIPEMYRNRQYCDHCNTNRVRHSTVLIQHEDGTIKQVGRNCLADFIRCPEIEKYIQSMELDVFYNEIDEPKDYYDDGLGSLNNHLGINTKRFLQCVMYSIVNYRWVSSTEADSSYGEKTSTKNSALSDYFCRNTEDIKRFNEWINSEDNSKWLKVVEDSIEWAKNLTPKNDFEWNIKTIASSVYIKYEHTGFAAAIVSCYMKAKQIETEKTIKKQSEFIGEIGKREQFELKFTHGKDIDTEWGVTSIMNFIDKNDNVYVWFTNKNTADSIDTNDWFTCKATMKEHKTYNGKKQNIITRLKVLNEKIS